MLDLGLKASALEKLNLQSLGLDQISSTKDLLDLDLDELSNEVDGLETLAKQMESLTFTDMIDDGLLLNRANKKRSLKKGGKRKKQASKFSKMLQSPSSSNSVTLCQLMNICDSVPMSANMPEEKNFMLPFAASQRSELVVEAPDSLTSDSDVYEVVVAGNKTLEKAARMEDINFQQGLSNHREIDFSHGIPVLVRDNSTSDR